MSFNSDAGSPRVLMWPKGCWQACCKGLKKHFHVSTIALTPLPLLLEHSRAKMEGKTHREGLRCYNCYNCWDHPRSNTTCKSPNVLASPAKTRRTTQSICRLCTSFGDTSFRWFVTDTIACKVSYHTQSHSIAINSLGHKFHESTDLVWVTDAF